MSKAEVPDLGQKGPDFAVSDAAGSMHELGRMCADRPLVLVFYRGHW